MDTSKVSVDCRYFSPWTTGFYNGILFVNSQTLEVIGQVKLLKVDKRRIIFRQKIIVNDKQRKRKYSFNGIRSIKITNQ